MSAGTRCDFAVSRNGATRVLSLGVGHATPDGSGPRHAGSARSAAAERTLTYSPVTPSAERRRTWIRTTSSPTDTRPSFARSSRCVRPRDPSQLESRGGPLHLLLASDLSALYAQCAPIPAVDTSLCRSIRIVQLQSASAGAAVESSRRTTGRRGDSSRSILRGDQDRSPRRSASTLKEKVSLGGSSK